MRSIVLALVLACLTVLPAHAQFAPLRNAQQFYRNGASLDLDFVGGHYMVSVTAPVTYTSLTAFLADTNVSGTFSRSSIATYFDSTGTLQTAPANTPRFDYDPVTLAAKGLLIEETRANLITTSAQASYLTNKVGITTSDNVVTAPNGNNTASQILETISNTGHYAERVSIGTTANQSMTFSAYLKPVGVRNEFWVQVFANAYADNIRARCITSSVSVTAFSGGTGAVGAVALTALPNGWYRCSVSGQPTTSAVTDTTPRITIINGSSIYAGDITQGVDVWGMQLEQGAFPTSYISTSGTTVTRQADRLIIPTGAWYSQTAGTLEGEGLMPYLATISKFPTLVSVNDGTTSNALDIFVNLATGGKESAELYSGGSQVYASSGLPLTTSTRFKGAIEYQTNNVRSSFDGTNYYLGNSSISIPTMTQLSIGGSPFGYYFNGTISRAWYMPTRQPDFSLPDYTR